MVDRHPIVSKGKRPRRFGNEEMEHDAFNVAMHDARRANMMRKMEQQEREKQELEARMQVTARHDGRALRSTSLHAAQGEQVGLGAFLVGREGTRAAREGEGEGRR